jgi:outer membrane murein-binding lipoprotein Lpp
MRSFVSALSALLLAIVCSSCGIADGASSSTVGRASSDVPETLSAAVAAAQANADRFSAGDFAGVWERMSRQVRDGITKDDFVTFYETCKKTGPTIRVAGVSLDAVDGTAVVRMDVGTTEQPRIMLFEDGRWVMKPTPGFAAHLGQPVARIIAEETSAGLCPN